MIKYPENRILMTGPNPHDPGGISTSVRGFLNIKNDEKIKIEHYLTGKPISQRDSLYRYLYRNLAQLFGFLNLILKKDFSIVHIHTSSWGGFWRSSLYVFFSKITNSKIILHIHGAEFKTFYKNSGYLNQSIIRGVLLSTTCLIVLSEAWEKFFTGILPSHSICILENLVEIPNNSIEMKTSEKVNILFLGGLTKRKGLNELMDAIPLFANSDYNVSFTISGFTVPKEYKLRERLEKLSEDSNLSKILNFMPDIPESKKWRLYLESNIYILQSYDEGLPFSLLEAMAYGSAVIATPVGAIPEVIIDGENGFLVSPGDSESLTEKIKLLLDSPELIISMGQANIKKIKNNFGINALRNKIAKIYRSC